MVSLLWRHNEHDSVSNHQPRGCLLNRLFRRRSKKTSKLRVTGLCVGNSPGPVNSPHKGPVTRKMFPFDDVIMSFYRDWLQIDGRSGNLDVHVQAVVKTDGRTVVTPSITRPSVRPSVRPSIHPSRRPVTSFTKEVNPRLAKRPLIFNGRLADNRGLTSLVKEASVRWAGRQRGGRTGGQPAREEGSRKLIHLPVHPDGQSNRRVQTPARLAITDTPSNSVVRGEVLFIRRPRVVTMPSVTSKLDIMTTHGFPFFCRCWWHGEWMKYFFSFFIYTLY